MTDSGGKGLGERPQHGFASDDGLAVYRGLYRLVLVAYDYRCALTGARFAPPVLDLHAELAVVAIQPREQGGPLAVSNYLPMIEALDRPFRAGLITIAADDRIVLVQPDLVSRDLAARLRPGLVLPSDELFRPDRERLAHHRHYALGR